MNVDSILENMYYHRKMMYEEVEKLNALLINHFGNSDIVVAEERADGFIFIFLDEFNTALTYIDVKKLLTMGKDDALEYLTRHSF